MKKLISIAGIILLLILYSISGQGHQQDINDVAYVIAIRSR